MSTDPDHPFNHQPPDTQWTAPSSGLRAVITYLETAIFDVFDGDAPTQPRCVAGFRVHFDAYNSDGSYQGHHEAEMCFAPDFDTRDLGTHIAECVASADRRDKELVSAGPVGPDDTGAPDGLNRGTCALCGCAIFGALVERGTCLACDPEVGSGDVPL